MTNALALLLAAALASAALAQQTDPPARPDGDASAENNAMADEITPQLDEAVNHGLKALAALQNQDGSFGGGRFGRNVAITSLACIAFMADGNLPDRGPYGDAIERGLDYVLDNVTDSGLIADETANGPMYGHGFATLFLGEIYGMTGGRPDDERARRVHEALVKAVRLIEGSQNHEGGWRYNPVPYDADVSVTICQVMALRSARNAGLHVDAAVIDKAVKYVRGCQNPDGGFRYQNQLGESGWARSAAGVATLFYAGVYEGEEIDRGLKYLATNARPGLPMTSTAHFHYGHYYAVQAMYLAGGESWENWWPAIRDYILSLQQADGSWSDRSIGDTYATAMSLIILQMPKRYLPIFQK
ncbi:MAG: terpene cyclase/mutase family protein [Planctomycetes bacterium]|nr:terpene cyclase/mutase family protein [Planctomycetota bacterium]